MTQFASKEEKTSLFSLPNDLPSIMKGLPKYKWFKPILALLIFAVLYMVLGAIAIMANLIYIGAEVDPTNLFAQKDAYVSLDYRDPIGIILTALSVIIMIPAAWIAVKVTGLGSLRTLGSVKGGLRWDLVKKIALPLFCLGLVLVAVLDFGDFMLRGEPVDLSHAGIAPLALLAIVLIVPIQSAAEEYFFRGLLFQSLGSWIPVAAVTLILQSIIFAAMHGYNLLGIIGVCISGLLLGWIALKTGGLEASICMHAANNVANFLLASIVPSFAMVSTVTPMSLAGNIICTIILALFAFYLCKRNGYVISDKKSE